MQQQLVPAQSDTAVRLPGVNQSGFVPTGAIMPNPLNFRFDFDDLEDLAASMQEHGQLDALTVRLLTPAEMEQNPGKLYMLIGGECRWRTARDADIALLEVRVKAYTDILEEARVVFSINDQHKSLSPLETALAVIKLTDMHGWRTQDEIAAHVCRSQVYVGKCLALRDAHEGVLRRMHPKLPKDKRWGLDVGAFVAKTFDLDAQAELVQTMPPRLVTGAGQLEWLRNQAEHRGVHVETRTRNPNATRRLIATLADIVYRKSKAILDTAVSRISENAKPRELGDLLGQLDAAIARLTKVRDAVAQAARAGSAAPPARTMIGNGHGVSQAPPPSPSPVRAMPPPPPAKPEPRAVAVSSGGRTPDVRPPVGMSSAPVPLARKPSGAFAPRPAPVRGSFPEQGVLAEVWDEQEKRFFMRRLSRFDYKTASHNKLLRYQKEGKPRPADMPDPATL